MAEHVERLAGSLNGAGSEERDRAFLARLIRPHGLDRRATDVFADAVERLAGERS